MKESGRGESGEGIKGEGCLMMEWGIRLWIKQW